uniref:Uncharacterized protein n=1 Tax=Pararge aegeria TaxID=116150 RepID=S4NWV5_9NEOP
MNVTVKYTYELLFSPQPYPVSLAKLNLVVRSIRIYYKENKLHFTCDIIAFLYSITKACMAFRFVLVLGECCIAW